MAPTGIADWMGKDGDDRVQPKALYECTVQGDNVSNALVQSIIQGDSPHHASEPNAYSELERLPLQGFFDRFS